MIKPVEKEKVEKIIKESYLIFKEKENTGVGYTKTKAIQEIANIVEKVVKDDNQ